MKQEAIPVCTDTTSLRVWQLVQRLIAGAALILLSPLLLLLMVAVRIDSRGPFLYCQERPGLGGRSFRTWKIRSMHTGADRNRQLALATRSDAPEITRVGRVLRELKLDELPQLWNVARGDMSLVGPRPIAPALQARLQATLPGFEQRLAVRPGLTSLGQICIEENEAVDALEEDWALRFEGEQHYIAHRSVFYDLAIIAMTVLYLARKIVRRAIPTPAPLAVCGALLVLATPLVLSGCHTVPGPGFASAEPPFGERARPIPTDTTDAAGHAATLELMDVTLDASAAEGFETDAPAYVLGAGDILHVNVFNEPGLEDLELVVDSQGWIQLPLLRRANVLGKTTAELQEELEAGYAAHYVDPWVVISLRAARSRPIYLLGEFRSAGVRYMDRPMRLLQVLATGEGISENAWLRGSRLIRDSRVAAVDIHALLRGAATDQNVWVEAGDTLYIPALTDQRIFTLGAVNRPGAQPLSNHSMTLLEAISRAQDVRRGEANTHAIRIIRAFSATSGQLIVVDLEKILRGEVPDFPLQAGDVVYVPNNLIGDWNDVIAAVSPTLRTFSAALDPFVTMRALEN